MASGLLGKAAIAANVYTGVYQAPTSGIVNATGNIRLINRDKVNSITVRLYIVPSSWVSGQPADADVIVCPDMVIPPGETGGITEDIAIAMSPGERVVAFSPSGTLTCRVHGYEKATA